MMKRLYIIVEGQTEEEFVNTILSPYFIKNNVYDIRPIKIQTSKGHKGGFVNYKHLKNDVNKLLKSQTDIIVTTLIDFFRLPESTPNYHVSMRLNNSIQKVESLERAIFEDVSSSSFLPYIQLHEFEALLFSSIIGYNSFWNTKTKIISKIQDILSKYPNPEDINDNPITAPSKRLSSIIQGYDKIVYGNLIAQEIGIEKIIEKCPRFRNWINALVTKLQE